MPFKLWFVSLSLSLSLFGLWHPGICSLKAFKSNGIQLLDGCFKVTSLASTILNFFSTGQIRIVNMWLRLQINAKGLHHHNQTLSLTNRCMERAGYIYVAMCVCVCMCKYIKEVDFHWEWFALGWIQLCSLICHFFLCQTIRRTVPVNFYSCKIFVKFYVYLLYIYI